MSKARPEQLEVTTGITDNDTVATKGYVDDSAGGPPFDNIDISGNTISSTSGNIILDSAANINFNDKANWVNTPLFAAEVPTTINDISGAGETYTVVFGTEIEDRTNNYNNSTGVFTVPTTGHYIFHTAFRLLGLTAAHQIVVWFSTGGNSRRLLNLNGSAASGGRVVVNGGMITKFNSGNGVSVVVNVSGGATSVDIENFALFSGYLLTL